MYSLIFQYSSSPSGLCQWCKIFGFHKYAKFCSNVMNAHFPVLNPCHLLDKLFLICGAEVSLWVALLELPL